MNVPGDPEKRVAEFESVQIYARGPKSNPLCVLTAGSADKQKIHKLADYFHKRGYGVQRGHIINATRREYTLRAEWAAPGTPTREALPCGS
jgi:hypothetical protein